MRTFTPAPWRSRTSRRLTTVGLRGRLDRGVVAYALVISSYGAFARGQAAHVWPNPVPKESIWRRAAPDLEARTDAPCDPVKQANSGLVTVGWRRESAARVQVTTPCGTQIGASEPERRRRDRRQLQLTQYHGMRIVPAAREEIMSDQPT